MILAEQPAQGSVHVVSYLAGPRVLAQLTQVVGQAACHRQGNATVVAEDPYRNPAISTNTSAPATRSRHTCAGGVSFAVKYAMSTTASSAFATADSAAATKDRPAGNSRSSEVWDRNTRRGSGPSPDMPHSMPGLCGTMESMRERNG